MAYTHKEVLPRLKGRVVRHAHVVHHAGHIAEAGQLLSVMWDSRIFIISSGVALIVCIFLTWICDEP